MILLLFESGLALWSLIDIPCNSEAAADLPFVTQLCEMLALTSKRAFVAIRQLAFAWDAKSRDDI